MMTDFLFLGELSL